MNSTKIQMCREQWQILAPHVKDRPTAKYLIAAVEIAEALLCENNRLEMENRQLRSTVDDYETQWVDDHV